MITEKMMTYEHLIDTIREVINNDKIYKKNMMIVYELDEHNHKKMDEHLFYSSNEKKEKDFEHRDVFDVELEGLVIRFIKKMR